MKITPTMPREHRTGFASPVFHPRKWPPWPVRPYHREGAAPLQKVRLSANHATDEQEREHWPKVVKFWEEVQAALILSEIDGDWLVVVHIRKAGV